MAHILVKFTALHNISLFSCNSNFLPPRLVRFGWEILHFFIFNAISYRCLAKKKKKKKEKRERDSKWRPGSTQIQSINISFLKNLLLVWNMNLFKPWNSECLIKLVIHWLISQIMKSVKKNYWKIVNLWKIFSNWVWAPIWDLKRRRRLNKI